MDCLVFLADSLLAVIACPYLPEISGPHDFTLTRRHGGEKGAAFYRVALCWGLMGRGRLVVSIRQDARA
ncbi:MAG: hypothetical protein EOP85_17390 [Verrucomicrobiaceae bacterium]|nr:MAG: hypothetical protein EOP85_17390 [Verrucomicrobiaceae bacterium]